MDYEPQDPRWETDEPTLARHEAEAQQSRRSLLGALGGLTLAASGLLLPDWLVEDADAAELPVRRVQQRKAQRHKKRRHDRKQRRKNDDKPRGRGPFEFRNMAIAVHNYRKTPVRVRGWQSECNPGCISSWEMPTVWDWKELPANGGATEFVSARMRVAVQIGDNRVVYGYNRIEGLPVASISTGGWGKRGWENGESIVDETGMWVNRSLFSGDIRVTRVGDTEDHILYSVDLS